MVSIGNRQRDSTSLSMRLLPLAASVVVVLGVGAPRRAEADSEPQVEQMDKSKRPRWVNSLAQLWERGYLSDGTVGAEADFRLTADAKFSSVLREIRAMVTGIEGDGTPGHIRKNLRRFAPYHAEIEEKLKAVGEGKPFTRLFPHYEYFQEEPRQLPDGTYTWSDYTRLGVRIYGRRVFSGEAPESDGHGGYRFAATDSTGYVKERGIQVGPLHFGSVVMVEPNHETNTGTAFARRALVFGLGPFSFKLPFTAKGIYNQTKKKFSGGLLNPIAMVRYYLAHSGRSAPPYEVESIYLRGKGRNGPTGRSRRSDSRFMPRQLAGAHP